MTFSQKFLEQDREVSIIVADNASQHLGTSMEDLPQQMRTPNKNIKSGSFYIKQQTSNFLESQQPKSIDDTMSLDRQITNEDGLPTTENVKDHMQKLALQ